MLKACMQVVHHTSCLLTCVAILCAQFTAPALGVVQLEHGLPVRLDVVPQILLMASLQHAAGCLKVS